MKIVERRLGRMLLRGVVRRCPRCGGGHLFRGWVNLAERCPACGIKFERNDEGFMLGVMAINMAVCTALFVVYLVLAFVLTWPDPPVVLLTAIGVALLVVAPVVLYPISKTVWTAIDLFMRPPEQRDLSDAATHARGAAH